MKHETVKMSGVKVIGIAKEMEMSKGAELCPLFWKEFVSTFIQSTETTPQKAAVMKNCIGEYALCLCDMAKGTFTYVIAGTYRGGDVPDGFSLYDIHDGDWLKVEFEGGMTKYHQQYSELYDKFLSEHPEYKVRMDTNMEWYDGMDCQAPDYRCGVMLPLVK